MAPFWRLDLPFRYALYAAFAVLFVSGAGWLIADWLKERSDTEIWQQLPAYWLMHHGGTATLTLMLLGALFPLHTGRAWRAKKNRLTGSIMIACNAMLIATDLANSQGEAQKATSTRSAMLAGLWSFRS